MKILKSVRRQIVDIRDSLDAKAHSSRRDRAKHRLSIGALHPLLFLCYGNVCRSPYAERVTLRSGGLAGSAGFYGPDRTPPDTALSAAIRRNIDHADHRSQLVTATQLIDAAAIFVFDRYNVAALRKRADVDFNKVYWLGDFDPIWAGKRAIIDPWGKTLADFLSTFERIERCVDEVVAVLQSTDDRT